MAKILPRTRKVDSPQVSTSSASGRARQSSRNRTNVTALASGSGMAHAIPSLDAAAMDRARARQASLTKPAGSLGRLEDLGVRVAGMTGMLDPPLRDAVGFTLA